MDQPALFQALCRHVTNPYKADAERIAAAALVPSALSSLDLVRPEQMFRMTKSYAAQIDNFLIIAEDSSEHQAVRLAVLEDAIGGGLEQFTQCIRRQQTTPAATMSSRLDFAIAAVALGTTIRSEIKYHHIVNRLIDLIENNHDDPALCVAALDVCGLAEFHCSHVFEGGLDRAKYASDMGALTTRLLGQNNGARPYIA